MIFAYEFQGVDLSNVVMCLEEDQEIVKALRCLESIKVSEADSHTVTSKCDILAIECKKGMAEKVLCTNHKGYEILVELAKTSNGYENIQAAAIRALAILLDKNPDGFDVEGFAVVIMGLDSSKGTA